MIIAIGLDQHIPEHYSLIASTDVLFFLVQVNALSDLRRLLFDTDEHIASFVVKAFEEKNENQLELVLFGQKQPAKTVDKDIPFSLES